MAKPHTLRIVGGDYRRTRIPVIDAATLRPTPERVRETLYNWLGHLWGGHFGDKTVLDLFAGTGALGFEAASRGVAQVLMVEHNPAAVAALRNIRTKLGASQVRVHAGDAMAVLQRLQPHQFDLILLDPPFAQDWLARIWDKLPALLKPNGFVYVEAATAQPPPAHFSMLRQDRAGQVYFHLLTRTPALNP